MCRQRVSLGIDIAIRSTTYTHFYAKNFRNRNVKISLNAKCICDSISVYAAAIGTWTHTRSLFIMWTARPRLFPSCVCVLWCGIVRSVATCQLCGTRTSWSYIDDALTWDADNNVLLLRNLVPFNAFMYADNKKFIFWMIWTRLCVATSVWRVRYSRLFHFSSSYIRQFSSVLRCVILILFFFTIDSKMDSFMFCFIIELCTCYVKWKIDKNADPTINRTIIIINNKCLLESQVTRPIFSSIGNMHVQSRQRDVGDMANLK